MKYLGWGLIVLGALMCIGAAGMDVTVSQPELAFADPQLADGRVANWDLIGQRTLLGMCGSAMFISGWLALILRAVTVTQKG